MERLRSEASRKFVAIVEDEAVVRDIAAVELEDHGFAVLAFATADEALPYLEAHGRDIAVLVTDVQMPGILNGLELVRILKGWWPKLPILVTSGGPLVDPKQLPPMVRFIPKPWRPADMAARVEEMVLAAA